MSDGITDMSRGMAISQYNPTKMPLRQLAKELDIAEKAIHHVEVEYEAKKEIAQKRLVELQEMCPHPEVKRIPDASGNNDSYDECRFCKKELR